LSKIEKRDKLVLDHLRIVKAIAVRVHESLPAHVDLDDLINSGMVGLIDAATKFDARKKVAFSSYAKHRIRGAILDMLRGVDHASRDLRRQLKKTEQATYDLTVELGCAPSDVEVAAKLGIDLDVFRQQRIALRALGTISGSTRKRIHAIGLHGLQEGDDLPAPDFACSATDLPETICLEKELSAHLLKALDVLKPRYRKVVELYYRNEITMHEIGGILGVNESRVCQMHKRALELLRKAFEAQGVTSAKAFTASA